MACGVRDSYIEKVLSVVSTIGRSGNDNDARDWGEEQVARGTRDDTDGDESGDEGVWRQIHSRVAAFASQLKKSGCRRPGEKQDLQRTLHSEMGRENGRLWIVYQYQEAKMGFMVEHVRCGVY